MSETLIWLLAFVGLYWVFCLYWGVTAAAVAPDAKSFFLADRNLPAWVFVLAATGASFSGWMFIGQPDLVASGGFPAAAAALAAITIPLGGVIVLKRQWMLARRYGFVTPVEMAGEYYSSEALRVLMLVVALVFAIPFVGLQIGAAGTLLAKASGGAVDRTAAMWLTTGVLFAYVCFGGLRAAAWVGALQALLLGAGMVGLGLYVYGRIGGFAAFNQGLETIGAGGLAAGGPGGIAATSLLEVPGVVQFVGGLGYEPPVGGAWTGVMILSYALGLMGIQLAPAVGMLGFAARSPKGFRAQQTWASGAVLGGILVLFTVAQGFSGALLGIDTREGGVVAGLVADLSRKAPWFGALFAVCALAAVQGLAALTLSTTATMLVRDVYRRYVRPDLDIAGQRFFARVAMALIAVVALLLASFAPGAQAMLGSLALGYGVQLLPVLVGLCWIRWITPAAAVVGLATGLVFATFTDSFGIAFAGFFGLELPWGRWPWTIHAAGWGLVFNIAVVILVSLISQRREDRERRSPFHEFLATHAGVAINRHVMRPVAWAAALAWFFFGIGPGVLFGNFAFGAPEAGVAGWSLGVPSLWAWQILWWALGVLLLWLLATRMRMATEPVRRIELLPRSQRPSATYTGAGEDLLRRGFWVLVAAGAAAVLLNWIFA